MKTPKYLLIACLLILQLTTPVFPQNLQSRHYRPLPNKCDRNGRCSPKEGYIEEVDHEDDYRSDKDRPTELTRDDWPARPGYDTKRDDKDDKPGGGGGRPVGGGGGGYGGGYNPKPTVDRDNPKLDVGRDDDIKPSGGGRPIRDDDIRPSGGGRPIRDDDIKPTGGGRPIRDDDIRPSGGGRPIRDDDIKPSGGGRPSGGYGGGYNPKPEIDDGYKPKIDRGRDDVDLKSSGGGGGRPSGGYGGGGYNPKPIPDRRDDPKPIRTGGGGGYGGGGRPKPVVDRDEYNPKPGGNRGGGGGYNPKPDDEDDYNIKPARGDPPSNNRNPYKEDFGGYNKEKSDDYNDDDEDDGGKDDDDYDEYGKPIAVVDRNCICVPYYQCQDGHIVTDGGGIIDARKKPDPDEEMPLDGKSKSQSCGPYHVCCNTPESSTVKPYEHRCGVRNPSGINSRILSPSNKGEADFGEWPWQAAVLKSEGKVNIFQCGGVLIDKYHVLTVAHCVFHLYQLNEYPLKVRLGEWDTQTTTEFLAHEDYKVSKIVIHPEFRNNSLWNDVAVLRLQDPVLFAPHIDTVCLPQYDEAFAGQNCVVTGWGKDAYKGGTFSNVMKEVALQVIDNYKCEEMLRKTRLGRFFQLHEGFLCAGGEYGIDSCKGDGGGPLVCYRKDKSYALAGIVSWGIDCGQPEVPGVYVKIQKYLDWISKTTGVSLQEYWPKH